MILTAVINGAAGAAALLAVYFLVVSLVSGLVFASQQFLTFWYFIVGLAAGFGTQIGLYSYLKSAMHRRRAAGGVVLASGAASTAAMVSCCAHYLVNVLPLLGVSAAVSVVSQYQIELFWAGLAFNIFAVAYLIRRILSLS